MKSIYSDFTLLVDGREAFPEIIRCIEDARESIRINMFIWRDDDIGNRIAAAVLAAAERGVKVTISKDRYGVVLEKAEECKKSFFHKKTNLTERIKTSALCRLYPQKNAPKQVRDCESELYRKIMTHRNISVDCNTFKADHSKFYVIDRKTLILGGINIEDKENGSDMQGRIYGDYMVKIVGESYVNAFITKMHTGVDIAEDYSFDINTKLCQPHIFEMQDRYLDIIRSAERELYITMAYFSPLPPFINAICDAHARGVKVHLMIPKAANFQNDSNRKTARKILKRTHGGVRVYLSPKMLHTKLIISEKEISLGSTNITKKAFCQLNELNLTIKNTPAAFTDQIRSSAMQRYDEAQAADNYKDIKYNKILAFLEGFLV